MSEPLGEQLVCVECGATASGSAEGWKAEIGDDLRDDDPPVIVILCADCWEREFGENN
jgi:hypothetical protein